MIDINEWMTFSKEKRQEHLNLNELCIERGGHLTQYRGVLAQYLNTTFPLNRKIQMCHACNNGVCSNPKHLYWGTASENRLDAVNIARKTGSYVGGRRSGFVMTIDTKQKISNALKGKPSNNPKGITGPKKKNIDRIIHSSYNGSTSLSESDNGGSNPSG